MRRKKKAESNPGIYKISIRKAIRKEWMLLLMLIPGILYFVVFKYGPMIGLVTAFQDYNPMSGWFHSTFVGLKHFKRLFSDPKFLQIFGNTLRLAFFNIVVYFPFPLILALLLNELKLKKYKGIVQSLIYIPHFVSWVVVAGICFTLFSSQSGVLNDLIANIFGKEIHVLTDTKAFVPLITMQVMWKEAGWGTIIFLAALSGVNMQLYEAAKIDGANRRQQMLHITLPALKTTIVTLLILRMGSFLNTGFEQIFLMLNSMNREVGEVFDTYVYQTAFTSGRISYGTTVGLFKSVVSLVLVIVANKLAKRAGEEGLY